MLQCASRRDPAPAPIRRQGQTVARIHVFADEAGNFDFSRNTGATRYFLLTTVVINDPSLELIQDKIASEFDLFRLEDTAYY